MSVGRHQIRLHVAEATNEQKFGTNAVTGGSTSAAEDVAEHGASVSQGSSNTNSDSTHSSGNNNQKEEVLKIIASSTLITFHRLE